MNQEQENNETDSLDGITEKNEELQGIEDELKNANQTIKTLELRQEIDQYLTDSQTVDLEVTRLLTESAISLMKDPDIRKSIDELKRRKPYLFKQSQTDNRGAMGRRVSQFREDSAENAAQKAITTGNRRDLLSYLRLKRS